jgi:diguanylate cyclase (GGDEF)-like protein
MEVNRAKGIAPYGRSGRGGGGAHGKRRDEGPGDEDQETEQRPLPADAFSVSGVPAGMMTPEGQAAVSAMVGEVERLRGDLEFGRRREAHLQKLADMHTLLPVFNRRALARELGRILAHVGKLGTKASLVCLHITNGEKIRTAYGRDAIDHGLGHLCRIIGEQVHPTDLVGHLGGYDFAIVFLVADLRAAQTKGAVLEEFIQATPFTWWGDDIRLETAVAAQVLEVGIDAETLLANADRVLLDEEKARAGQVPAQP